MARIFTSRVAIVYCVVWPSLIAFGFVSNLSFIWTVWRTVSLHTTTWSYLMCLACTDMINLLAFVFVQVRGNFQNSQTVGIRYAMDINDKMVNMAFAFVWVVSIGLITLVSFERFLAICHPIKHHLLKGTKWTFRLCVCTVSLAVVVYAVTTMPAFAIIKENLVCILWPAAEKYANYPQQMTVLSTRGSGFVPGLVYFAIMLIVVLFNCSMYIKILLALKARKENTTLGLSHSFENQLRQLAVMVIANGAVFFLFSFVQIFSHITYILQLFEVIAFDGQTYIVWVHFVYFSVAVNTSINPLVYIATNQRYRHAFTRAVFKCFCTLRESRTQNKASHSTIVTSRC